MVLAAPTRAEFTDYVSKQTKNKSKKLTRIAGTYEAPTASMNLRVHQSQSQSDVTIITDYWQTVLMNEHQKYLCDKSAQLICQE